ncbi:uncharacterized protein LOC129363099 isoform X4 [Poeciliopsis prolifica]|uniref:uncharacterized protein LOC129363099 isoform X4 n=1 Tax=Poeciliopsis prolifica TaxID=188132 RepID=UPI00241323F2|nr:uncharacterized protein LOC129363099 isoform X4 [Poeciliopsis prolifica]
MPKSWRKERSASSLKAACSPRLPLRSLEEEAQLKNGNSAYTPVENLCNIGLMKTFCPLRDTEKGKRHIKKVSRFRTMETMATLKDQESREKTLQTTLRTTMGFPQAVEAGYRGPRKRQRETTQTIRTKNKTRNRMKWKRMEMVTMKTMKTSVLLKTRSRCQTAAAEHQRKDDEEGDGDSETNRNEKTKSNEGETPQEPVDSETADVATNTSPQQEPAEQKVHELQVCRASCRHFDSAWFERTRRSHGCEHLGSIRITDEVGDEKRLRFGKHSHLGHSGELHVWGLDRFRRGLDGSGSAAERNSENAAGSCKRAKGGFENTEGILRFEIASFTSSDESGSFQFADAGCDATNSGRNGAFPVTRNYKELIILLPSSQEKL